jgi:acyl-CoA synthetase (AMP-forming)/AMP-acid ligase II
MIKRDVSGWETRLNELTIAKYVAGRQWNGLTLLDCAKRCVHEHPDRIAVIDGDVQLNFKTLLADSFSLASALRRSGMKPGDVLSFQLPNWHESLVINLAATIGGFVCNPIVPIYRDAEVRFILRNSRTKVLFIPEKFRSIDYVSMIERMRAELPHLQHVVKLRTPAGNEDSYAGWLERGQVIGDQFLPVDPNAVKLLLYTSGTTGDPKGVLHSHNTLRSDIDASIEFWSLTQDDVVLMPSPVTHITGYLYALELPFARGVPVVMMDRWEVSKAVALTERYGVTFSIGATPFLLELVAEVERLNSNLKTLQLYVSGGAPVPPEVINRARKVLPNCQTVRAYGCSEAPTISLGVRLGDSLDFGAVTDGFVYNHEIRVVDDTSGELLNGRNLEGEILVRGPEVMLGYTNPEHTAEAFDEDGFFRTGDLGRLDEHGYITISGRKKDLIIRGGENISAKEIEDILHLNTAIQEAAVVAMPHPRLGETPCAYVVLRPGALLDFDQLKAFLEQALLARQKIPERLFVVKELPRTSSGKVLKHVLRARVASDMAASSAAA